MKECDNCKHLNDCFCEKGRDMDEYNNLCELYEEEKKYQIIYADPAWAYEDKALAGNRGAGCKYDLMTIEEMSALPIKEISRFSDEIKGGIITREFTTDYIDPVKVEKEWQMIRSVKELAIKPIAILVAVDFLDANVLDKL